MTNWQTALANETSAGSGHGAHPVKTPQTQFVSAAADHSIHETAFDKAVRYAGIGATAIAVTPFMLKSMGIGTDNFDWVSKNCCPVTMKHGFSLLKSKAGEDTYGIAGTVASVLEHIPVVGGDLSRGGIANAIAAGGLMVLGHYGGQAVERLEKQKGFKGHVGRFIRNASQLLGVVVALPAILPGVGHGSMILSSVAGIDQIDKDKVDVTGPAASLAGILGKVPGECKREVKLSDGATGAGTVLLAQLCCAIPAIVGSLPIIFSGEKGIAR